MYFDRTDLVKQAIADAYNEAKKNVEVVGDYKYEYFKKGKAIWCRMINPRNEVVMENRVYKVKEDKPYVRWVGNYWYLSEEAKAIVKRMAS